MKNKIVFSLVIISVFLLTGCGPKSTTQTQTTQNTQSSTSGIIVPANLESCPERFYEKKEKGGMIVNCDEEPKGEFCSYYTTEKDGVTKAHNLQFISECILCRTHQQKGTTFLDNSTGKYVHLGYEKKACTQGMYKTKE